jgi:hypothetical protein
MAESSFTDWFSAIVALLAAVLAGTISVQVFRRGRREIIVKTHENLTTGEVAVARDVIGSHLYAKPSAQERKAAISSLFVLYWAVQRADNNMRLYWFRDNREIERSKIKRYLTWNLKEICSNIVEFRSRYSGRLRVEDKDAWEDFRERLRVRLPDLHEQLRHEFPDLKWY